ncbi:IS5 family transposase [Streptomyces griseomycini]|nr:IS5 family transposase [Streptomyces griseomycini]
MGRTAAQPRQKEQDDHALGRSRGGLTTKIHPVCDGRGRPWPCCSARASTTTARAPTPYWNVSACRESARPPPLPPRPPDRGQGLQLPAYLRRRGIAHTIPERSDQKGDRLRRGSVGGRPPSFDQEIYRRRNTVERCFHLLKGFRGIATRYDKTATSHEAAVCPASCLLWAKSL